MRVDAGTGGGAVGWVEGGPRGRVHLSRILDEERRDYDKII